MKIADSKQKPKMSFGWPEWFHHHGCKMVVDCFNKDQRSIFIKGSAASLEITKMVNPNKNSWLVTWEVIQSTHTKVNGSTVFSGDELCAAFGLSDETEELSDWLIEKFGGESASQRRYIRWKNFLNIPCPGTGNDGDPNISILIDDEIKKSIKQLLE